MSATLIAVAALTLIATVISFVVIMRPDAGVPTRDSSGDPFVDPDPAVLKTLSVPSAFMRVHHKLPNCRVLKMSRCYITALPEAQAIAVATRVLSMGHPHLIDADTPMPRHRWCGHLEEQPVLASLSPNVVNAKRVAENSWNTPGGPEFDNRWVLWVTLPGVSICD